MKRRIAPFLCVLAVAGVTSSRTLADESGRFQLFMGAYPFVNLKGEEYWEKALLRIDTATGKVWVARSTQLKTTDGKYTQETGWIEFEQNVSVPAPK